MKHGFTVSNRKPAKKKGLSNGKVNSYQIKVFY